MLKRALILTAGLLASGFAAATITGTGSGPFTIDCAGSATESRITVPNSAVATVNFQNCTQWGKSGVVATCDLVNPVCTYSATGPATVWGRGSNASVLQVIYFSAAPAVQAQTITFDTAPTIVAGKTGTVSAKATSGLTVTFSSTTPSICTVAGSTVTGVSAGTCVIAADQAGNSSYSAAPQVTQSITISPAPVAASIPTLSEWGMIFLSSLIAMVGIAKVRRRNGGGR